MNILEQELEKINVTINEIMKSNLQNAEKQNLLEELNRKMFEIKKEIFKMNDNVEISRYR